MIMTNYKLQTALFASIATLFLVCSVVNAEQPKTADKNDEHTTQQHSPHEHGVARITLAVRSQGLEIALETPAANLFGFEHKPTDGGEEATIYETIELLEDDSEIFKLPEEAACKTPDFEIESALIEKDDDHEDEEHDKDSEKTEKHTDHEDHTGKTEKHDNTSESAHNDVDATWNYSCDNPDKLSRVGVKLFTVIPNGFDKIHVEWITPTHANKVTLEGDGAVFLTQ